MVDEWCLMRCGPVRTARRSLIGVVRTTPDDHHLIPYERDLLRPR